MRHERRSSSRREAPIRHVAAGVATMPIPTELADHPELSRSSRGLAYAGTCQPRMDEGFEVDLVFEETFTCASAKRSKRFSTSVEASWPHSGDPMCVSCAQR